MTPPSDALSADDEALLRAVPRPPRALRMIPGAMVRAALARLRNADLVELRPVYRNGTEVEVRVTLTTAGQIARAGLPGRSR